MGEDQVKLHGVWISHYCRRVELALKIKGIEYEYIEEDLSNKSPSLLKYNPVHKKVPLLVHNGNPVADSLVILEYIDDAWPNNPLLPKDPFHRAMARFWAKFADEKVLPTAVKSTMGKDEGEREEAIEELGEQLKLLENELKEKSFFGGETIGYLDIVVFIMIHWFLIAQVVTQADNSVCEEKFPILFQWIGKVGDINLVKECLPPRDMHTAHVRARYEVVKSASK